MSRIEEIVEFIEMHSYFQCESDDEDFKNNHCEFATRENGNVGDEEFGDKDFTAAKTIVDTCSIIYPDFEFTIETVDEWVYVIINKKLTKS